MFFLDEEVYKQKSVKFTVVTHTSVDIENQNMVKLNEWKCTVWKTNRCLTKMNGCVCSYQICYAHVIHWSACRLRSFKRNEREKGNQLEMACWAENLLCCNVHFEKQWHFRKQWNLLRICAFLNIKWPIELIIIVEMWLNDDSVEADCCWC